MLTMAMLVGPFRMERSVELSLHGLTNCKAIALSLPNLLLSLDAHHHELGLSDPVGFYLLDKGQGSNRRVLYFQYFLRWESHNPWLMN